MSSFFDIDVDNAAIEVIHRDDHNHETDNRVIAKDQFLNNAKAHVSDDPPKPVKRLNDQQVALAHRNAATRGGRDQSPPVPEYSCVGLQLSKAKSKLLPQVPHHADEVIIQGSWRETWRREMLTLRQNND